MPFDREKLKLLRDAKGISQEQLGALIGANKQYIYRLESGETVNPGANYLTSLASALGVDPSELLAPAAPDAEKRLPLTRGGKPVDLPVAPVRVELNPKHAYMPLLGTVPGGPLMMVSDMDAEPYPVDPEMVRLYPYGFVVRVSGSSMTPVIQDGDKVIVDPVQGWRQGSTVIAEVDGEVTLKCIGEVDGKPALVPNNGNGHEAIVLGGAQQVKIQGIVVEVIRRISVAH